MMITVSTTIIANNITV